MKIYVTGYNEDGTLGKYDQEVKEKDRLCMTKKEECTSWLFFVVIISVLVILSYICLQGGLARGGYVVQVKGETGETGEAGKRGRRGRDTVCLQSMNGGLMTQEARRELDLAYDKAIKRKKMLEKMEKLRKLQIEKEIKEGKRLKSGVLVTRR
jgi:hypothetical protein